MQSIRNETVLYGEGGQISLTGEQPPMKLEGRGSEEN